MDYSPFCSKCGLCENFQEKEIHAICPRMEPPPEIEPVLGYYKKVGLVQGKFSGSYSGAVISIIIAAKETRLIDGVLGVKKGETVLQAVPKYSSTISEIKELSGMRHTISSHLSILNEIPANHKIAVIGLPCHVEAINKAKNNGFSDQKIEVILGIACGTNYLYSEFNKLLQEKNIEPKRIKEYTLRKIKFFTPYFSFLVNGETKEFKLPVSKTLCCIPRGCYYCNDYLGINSDLSFGVLGAPKGWSLVFIRTEKGEKLINAAIKKGYLSFRPVKEDFFSHLIYKIYRLFPTKLYLTLAFRTRKIIGAELMAKFKVNYLNKRLKKEEKHRKMEP